MYNKELISDKLSQVSGALDRIARRFKGVTKLQMISLPMNMGWICWIVSA